MPITLITGLPGHGKTLHTLWLVKQRAETDNRDVYYHNIPDLSLPWLELSEPREWFNCPAGSIIVLDECQRVFNRRSSSAQVPDYVQQLETHRHQGLDLYLVTQHPRLIDSHVRALVDTHIHVVRPFGKQYSKVFNWQGVNDNVERNHANAIVSRWRYPQEVFSYYRSAAQHTIKGRLPGKVFLFPFLLLIIFGLFYYVISKYTGNNNPVNQNSVNHNQINQNPVNHNQINQNPVNQNSVNHNQINQNPVNQINQTVLPSASEIAAMHIPAVPGIPGTAPIYWPLYSKPADYPKVTGCIYEPRTKRCQCYSQQGTRLDVPEDICRNYSDSAAFDHSRSASNAVGRAGEGRATSEHDTRSAPVVRDVL